MLTISNLHARVEGTEILKGLDLHIQPGEIHAIMGPNGSGKSTLAQALLGHPSYKVTSGTITFNGEQIQDMQPDERAKAGLFLAFQRPVEVPGITATNMLRVAKKSRDGDEQSMEEFKGDVTGVLERLDMSETFATRSFNEGFSGGERKKMEVLQAMILQPQLLVLDELDSGLDVDALRTVAREVDRFVREDKTRSVLLITHYNRILQYLTPHRVHVLQDGRIAKSGGPELAVNVEAEGYGIRHF